MGIRGLNKVLIGKQFNIAFLLKIFVVFVFIDLAHLRSIWAFAFFLLSFVYYILQSKRFTNDEWTDRWLVVSLWIGLLLFVGISPLALQDQTLAVRLFQVSSLLAFLFGGMLAIKSQLLTFKDVVNTFYISFFLIIGLSFLATMIQYGPFYRLIYQSGVIYVEGEQYSLANEFLMFQGWGVITTRIVWLDSWIMVGFTPLFLWIFKRRKQSFMYWLPTILSVFLMVGLPYGQPLYYVGIVSILIVGWIGFQSLTKSIQRLFSWGMMIVLFVGVFIGLADAFNWFSLSDTIQTISVLNRVYNNAFVDRYQAILVYVFQSPFGQYGQLIVANQFVEATGNIVLDIVYQAGWLSLLSFLTLLILNGLWLGKNHALHHDHKRWLQWLMVMIFLPWMLNYVLFPFVREQQEWLPQLFFEHPLFLITILSSTFLVTDPLFFLKKR